jgi:hypothetical protein
MNYSPRGLFDPNIFTEAELLHLRDTAVKLIAEGKTIMEYGAEGSSASREFTMPPADLLLEVTWSLKSKLPKKYGPLATRCRNWFYAIPFALSLLLLSH